MFKHTTPKYFVNSYGDLPYPYTPENCNDYCLYHFQILLTISAKFFHTFVSNFVNKQAHRQSNVNES